MVLVEVPAVVLVLVLVVVVVGASRMFLASSDLLVGSQRTSWVVEKLEDDLGIDRHASFNPPWRLDIDLNNRPGTSWHTYHTSPPIILSM
jgi:hypothetical protein